MIIKVLNEECLEENDRKIPFLCEKKVTTFVYMFTSTQIPLIVITKQERRNEKTEIILRTFQVYDVVTSDFLLLVDT